MVGVWGNAILWVFVLTMKNILAVLAILFTPLAFVHAQDTTFLTNLSSGLEGAITAFIPVLAGLAVLVFVWGLIVFIANADNEQQRQTGRQRMVWGLVGLFIVFSVWGLVQLMQAVFAVSTPPTVNKPGIIIN